MVSGVAVWKKGRWSSIVRNVDKGLFKMPMARRCRALWLRVVASTRGLLCLKNQTGDAFKLKQHDDSSSCWRKRFTLFEYRVRASSAEEWICLWNYGVDGFFLGGKKMIFTDLVQIAASLQNLV